MPEAGLTTLRRPVAGGNVRLAALLGPAVSIGAFPAGAQDALWAASPDEPVHELAAIEIEGRLPSMSSPKFARPVLETPRTVSIIPADLIESQNAATLRDVLRNAPGITFQAGEGGAAPGDNLFIRGFAARNDLFVDGVRDTGQYSRDPFNLEQVEVLKGPASSVLGRGVTGGAVNQASKAPTERQVVRSDVTLGTADYKRVTVDANQPVNHGTGFAARLNAMWTDGGVPGRDAVENSRWGVAPSIAWGLGKPTWISLGYMHLEQDNLPDYGLPAVAYTDPGIDWNSFYGLTNRDYEHIDHDSVNAELRHDWDDDLTLRSFTRWSRTLRDAVVTAPRLESGQPDVARRSDVKTQDREHTILANQTSVNLSAETGGLAHSIAAGVELSTENYVNHGRTVTGDNPTTDLYNPTPGDAWNGTVERTGAKTDTDADTLAFYAFDTIDLSSRWQMTAGLRWEQFDASTDNVDADGNVVTLDRTDCNVSWSAGLVFKPLPNGTVYASYGTSFSPSAEDLTLSLAGGRGGTSPAANHPDLAPEEARSLELGTKWEFMDQRLALSAALFRTEKDNARTRNASDEPYVLEGEQIVQGIELGVNGQLTEAWSVFAGYAYMDSEITESLAGAELGHELPYTPKHSFNIWTEYQLTHALAIGGGAQFTGEYYFNTTATPDAVPESISYWLFNAMARYDVNENLSLRLNVENIADEQYVERGYAAHFTPGRGRSVSLTAEMNF